ncbi:MAG: twin-arginine translocation signal domain-containing protein, partial [Desulfobacterales bacterium]|nr:twin-arginine translocation signal domain-containing protein [Desulfobacterales bacterium]
MDKKIIELHNEYNHGFIDRREFLRKLAVLAGGAAAASSLMFLLENNYAKAAMVPENDSRIMIERIKYPG